MNQVAIEGAVRDDNEQPGYMALTIGHLSLLTSSTDVISIESIDGIDKTSPAHNAVGWIQYYGLDIPAYSLTADLDIDSSTGGDKPICVVLKKDDSYIALLCRKAAPFENAIIRSFPLPECMRANGTPVTMLCVYRSDGTDGIACAVSAGSVIDYIANATGNANDTHSERKQPS